MQRIVNFRSIFFLFILSLFCIYFSFKATLNLFYLFFIAIPLVFFVYLIIKKKFILLGVSVSLLVFLSTYSFFYVKNYENHSYDNTQYTISGNINDIKKYTYSTRLILTNVSLIDENDNIHNIKGNLLVNLTEGAEEYFVGYTAIFNGEISPINIVTDTSDVNTFYVKNNIRYKVTNNISAYKTTFIEGKKPLNQTIKDYNKNILINNLGETKGNLAYALLYGDRAEVDINLINTFKYSGVIHIFAVSGLHISIIVGLIYFVLNKLKCNNKIILIISAVILLLYCYMCSFASSVVRATIMTLTVLFAKVVFRKNDSLTTLSFSGIVILLFSPLSLFDAGFQMTFTAVFGIIIFSDIFKKIKINNKVLKNIFLLISVSLSTQIALLPLFAKYYGYYSTWSIISNLFTLPIFSVFYPILFVTNLICVVCKFLGFLFFLPNALLSVIIIINRFIFSMPFGQITLFYCGGIITTLYYCFLFLISKYVLITKKLKPTVCAIGFIVVFSLFSYYTLPIVSTQNKIAFAKDSCTTNYSAIISTSNNKFYLINPKMSTSSLNNIITDLNSKRINKIDGIIFTADQSFNAKGTESFLTKYSTTIYLPTQNNATTNLQQMGVDVLQLDYNSKIQIDKKVNIEYLTINNQFSGTIIKIENYIYFELSMVIDDYSKYEILDEFISNNINFKIDCVKINDTKNKTSYYKSLINASTFIFNEDNNIVLTI